MPTTDFSEYFASQYPRIVAELTYIVGDRETARELAQEAFIRQYMKWNLVSRLDKPGAWVRKVAIRLAIRSRRRFVLFGSPEEAESVVSPSIDPDTVMDVRSAVMKLPSRQRVAVVLHYYRDLPVAAIGDAMNCSPATVKSHLHQGRQNLAELISGYGQKNLQTD